MPQLGCSSSSSAESALDAYARALEAGRYDAAYRLLTDDLRGRYSEPAFEEIFTDGTLGRDVAREIRGRKTGLRVVATATTGCGEVRLVDEHGQWFLDPLSIELYPQDTPARTVGSLVRAIDNRHAAVLSRFASEAHRSGLSAKNLELELAKNPERWSAISLSLHTALAAGRIAVSTDKAALLHARGTLRLVREAGEWKVDVFE